MNPRESIRPGTQPTKPTTGGDTTIDEGVCSMNTFFKSYFQSFLVITTLCFFLSVLAAIGFVVTPYYQNWSAGKAVQRAELVGMAELARMSQIAQIDVEIAQTKRIALGVQATGFKSAAKAQADAIKLIADALRKYPDNINDEYLNLMFKQTVLGVEPD